MQAQRRRRDHRLLHPEPIRLTKRDIDIVEAVHYYRVLKQEQLRVLFFGSRATAQLRLQKLYDHGYLDRRFLPVGIGQGRSPTIYVLDRRGATLLRAERGYNKVAIHPPGKTLSSPFIEHTLLVNDVLVAVYKACRANRFTLEQWQGESQIKRNYDSVEVNSSAGRTSLRILPDSYFTVIAHNRRYHFFLEVDMGTMTASRFKTKVQGYIAYHRDGDYERRYGTRSLRILTLVPSTARLKNLIRATMDAGGGQHFWFTTKEHIVGDRLLTTPVWTLAGEEGHRKLVNEAPTPPQSEPVNTS